MPRHPFNGQTARLLSVLLIFMMTLCASTRQASAAQARDKEGILLAAFGTSVPEAWKSFENIEAVYKKEFPHTPIVWAFTSQKIRKKLASRGHPVGSIGEGLAALAKEGVRTVRVQSLHVMAGEEFAELERSVLLNIKKNPGLFDAVYLARPLLESRADALALADAVLPERQKGKCDALAFMAHGQEHGRADLVFEGTRAIFHEKDPRVFMATVEGSRGQDELMADLKGHDIKSVCLAPLMVVAGDHARNDLGGEEDSWAARLKSGGYEPRVSLKGLGEYPAIARMFTRHTAEAKDDLTLEPKKP